MNKLVLIDACGYELCCISTNAWKGIDWFVPFQIPQFKYSKSFDNKMSKNFKVREYQ